MKKLGLVLLIILMITSNLFANGSQEKPVESRTNTVNKTGLPIVNEKETFTVAVHQTSPIKEAALRQCVLDAEKATNIHFEWIEIPQSAWKEKINIMFSTGNLPDLILSEVDVARNYEQLVPVSDYIDEYAPNYANFLKERPDYISGLTAPDGKMHALPSGEEGPLLMIDSITWINTAWLDALGLEMPTTTDEFRAVLEAFKNNDPNGNGIKDEIPLVFEGIWGWANSMENLFGPFGVVESDTHTFMKEGKVIFSAQEEGYYEALKYYNELYTKGLISPESFTMSTEQYNSFSAGKDTVGCFIGWRPNEGSPVANLIKSGYPMSNYEVLPILSSDISEGIVSLNNITRIGSYYITTSCKNPAALVRFYDYINSSYEIALPWVRGPKGVWWDFTEVNGEQVPVKQDVSQETLDEWGYKSLVDLKNAESFAGQTPTLLPLDFFEKEVLGEGMPRDLRLEWILANKNRGVVTLPAGIMDQEDAERKVILLADIDNYLEKFVADSIMNGIDDKKWEKHLKTLKDLKVPEYIELCQKFVDRQK